MVNRAPRTCISVLNWRNSDDTVRCIQSLRDGTDLTGVAIVVLDNESTDASFSALSTLTDVTITRSTENLGFAGGHNRTMRWAKQQGFDYVWLLNNDAVVRPQCLQRLLAFAEQNPDCALVSPGIFDREPPHAAQHLVSVLNETRTGAHEYTDAAQAARMQQQHPEKMILWGTALLVRVAALDRLGYLDEGLFAYAEDTDYALRALQCGFRNAVVLEAEILHAHPQPPRNPHFYYYKHRNSVAIARKHAGILNTLKLMRLNLILARKELSMLKDRPEAIDALYGGIWHGWTRRTGAFRPGTSVGWAARTIINLALKVS